MDGFRKSKDGISRRKLLKTTGKVGAAGAVGTSPLLSGCTQEVVGSGGLKIGVLFPYGFLGRWGRTSTWGFLSGLASAYGEDPIPLNPDGLWAGEEVTFETEDRKYQIIIRDTTYDPSTAEEAATDLVLDENVDMLFGVLETSSTIRVIEQVSKPTDTLHITGGVSSIDVTGNTNLCGRKVFRANENTGMEARALAKYIGEETDTESMYLLGADNSFGRSSIPLYRRALEANGVEVAGERFVPSGFTEFRGVLENIDEQAEAIGAIFGGRTIETLFTSFIRQNVSGNIDLRAHGALPGIISMGLVTNALESTFDEITEEAIQESNIGGLVSRYHWNQYDNPINDEFVPAFEETYGTLPALFVGGAFAAGSSVAQAVEETGSTNGDDIAEAMYGMTVEQTPKGENGYVFQEHNNQAKSPMTVANLVPNEEENWDASVMPSEPIMRVSADEAAVPVDDPDMNCDLREG
jgi:branched-chain amino acid transport system substrate-binding protein